MKPLAFIFLCACTQTADNGPSTTGGTVLSPADVVLSPSSVTFSTVSIGATAAQSVSVENSGQSATDLADQSTSLGDFGYAGGVFPGTGGSCAATLGANASCTIVIAFSPTEASAESATLTLSYASGKTATAQLSGTGRDAAALAALAGVDKTTDFLGTVTTTNTGRSPTLQAIKASGDSAITIIALGDDPTPWLAIDELTTPNGTELANLNDFDTQGNFTSAELNRSYPAQGVQAVVVPQTPDIAAQTPAGTYDFSVVAFDDNGNGLGGTTADVYVVHTATPGQHVNVNLFFSGSAGMTATTAQSDGDFQTVICEYLAMWGQAPAALACPVGGGSNTLGLIVDSVSYFDLPSGYEDLAGDASEASPPKKDLEELFQAGAGQAQGVNFFFIDDIAVDGLSSSSGLLGLDGSIPAPGALQGTPRSGAVVILDSVPSAPDDLRLLASTIAHEGGHYLGLYHNQESDCATDNLSDTPCDSACMCAKPSDCEQAPEDCSDDESTTRSNVMFWGANENFPQTLFTNEQAAVASHHPLVH